MWWAVTAVTQVSPSATQNFAGVKADIRSTTSNAHLSVKHETSVDCSSKEGKPVAGPRRQQLVLKLQYSPCTWTLPVLCYSCAEAHKSTGPELASATLQAQRCQLRWKKPGGCGSRTATHMGNVRAHSHLISASLCCYACGIQMVDTTTIKGFKANRTPVKASTALTLSSWDNVSLPLVHPVKLV